MTEPIENWVPYFNDPTEFLFNMADQVAAFRYVLSRVEPACQPWVPLMEEIAVSLKGRILDSISTDEAAIQALPDSLRDDTVALVDPDLDRDLIELAEILLDLQGCEIAAPDVPAPEDLVAEGYTEEEAQVVSDEARSERQAVEAETEAAQEGIDDIIQEMARIVPDLEIDEPGLPTWAKAGIGVGLVAAVGFGAYMIGR